MKYAALIALLILSAILVSQPSRREEVGRQPDGSFLLNSGWRIQPAGKQLPLDTFPMATALSRDGNQLDPRIADRRRARVRNQRDVPSF